MCRLVSFFCQEITLINLLPLCGDARTWQAFVHPILRDCCVLVIFMGPGDSRNAVDFPGVKCQIKCNRRRAKNQSITINKRRSLVQFWWNVPLSLTGHLCYNCFWRALLLIKFISRYSASHSYIPFESLPVDHGMYFSISLRVIFQR